MPGIPGPDNFGVVDVSVVVNPSSAVADLPVMNDDQVLSGQGIEFFYEFRAIREIGRLRVDKRHDAAALI